MKALIVDRNELIDPRTPWNQVTKEHLKSKTRALANRRGTRAFFAVSSWETVLIGEIGPNGIVKVEPCEAVMRRLLCSGS